MFYFYLTEITRLTSILKLFLDTFFLRPGKRGHIVADTLLPTQMFPRLPARPTFVSDTNFVSLLRNILCLQQMFPSLRSPRNIMGNNVSSFARAFKHGAILYNEAEVFSLSITNPNGRPMLPFHWLIYSSLILPSCRVAELLFLCRFSAVEK